MTSIKYSVTCKVIVAVLIMLTAYFTLHTIKMPFLADDFLIEDDLIQIPKWQYQNFSPPAQGIPTFTCFLSLAFKFFREAALIRMSLIAVFAFSIGLFSYVMLYEYSIITVGFLALLIALVQMGVDQGILIVGSYPMLGVSMTLIAFSLIYSASRKMANPLLLIIPGYIFATLAQLVHPIFIFVPCSFLILLPIFNKKYAVINIICIAASYIVRLFVMSTYIYHYSSLKGWIDYSIDAIFLKNLNSIDYVLLSINRDGKILLAMTVLLFFALLINMFTKDNFKQFDRTKILTPIYFLILAILTYGPTVVITHINTRYFYAPQLFCIMALILSILQLSKGKLQRYIINTMLILLCISFYINSKEFHNNRFENLRQMQSNIKRSLLKDYINSASKNDQIILLMNQLPEHFTSGCNHWSTWFLRYYTENRHLIGLVGDKDMCRVYPIVDKYKDHGDEYWGIKKYNGKDLSYRIRMKGIEFHRNTYAFQETKAGISPIPFLSIPSKDGLFHIAESGMPFKTVDTDNPLFLRSLKNCFMWDIKDINFNQKKIKLSSARIQYSGKYFEFNGHEFLNRIINIKNIPSSLTFKFMLRSVENVPRNLQQYGDTLPPMPLIAGSVFSVYQTNNDSYTFQIRDKKGMKYIKQKIVRNKWQKYELHFDFLNNMLYFYLNDSVLNIIRNIDIDISELKSITIGKGYKQRFWKGDFAYFEVYENNGSEKVTYLNLVPEN